jgi:hypothetical protein
MMEYYIHELDKSNFFYSTISTLSFAHFGVDELFARGFYILHRQNFPNDFDFVRHIQTLGFPEEVVEQIIQTKTFTPFIFIPGFITKDKRVTYRMLPNESGLQFAVEERGITGANVEFTHWAIISAWEKILPYDLPDSKILQFFRHIRNAAAHNGKFHFTNKVIDNLTGELKKEAEWKSFVIKSSFQGLKLFADTKADSNCFWDQGDLVTFLLDFQNHYSVLKK